MNEDIQEELGKLEEEKDCEFYLFEDSQIVFIEGLDMFYDDLKRDDD